VRTSPARQSTRPHAAPIAPGLRRPHGLEDALAHPLALGALAGALALALARWGPPGTDLPAHLYAIDAWRESGVRVWDNLWYGGRYAQVSYSPLFPPLAALLGPAAVAAISAAGAAVAFAQVLRARWGSRSAPAAVAFALLAPAAVLSGQLPFLLGIALALSALWALQGGRVALALVLLLLTALASPLALAFAVVPLIAVAATTPGWWRQRRLLVAAAGVCVIVALVWLQQRAFARAGGRYPASPSEAVTIGLWCAAGLALAWRVAGQRLMLAVPAVCAALGAVALAVPSPVGGNWVRLVLFMGAPLLLVPMAARRFRPLVLVLPVLAIALAWQMAYIVGVARESAASRSSEEAFWRPVEGFLARHATPDHRVEAVATTGRWEAYYLPRRGVPIARGWFRQDDWPQNAPLYDGPLTPASYRRWLRDVGVRYVVLPNDHRDASARAEALLVRSGSVLPVVARMPGWTVYELPDATPIATPAGGIRVTALDEDAVTLRVARPGTYRLRLTYTPYWRVEGPGCVEPRAPWGTTVRAAAPGTVVLRVDVTAGRVLDALMGRSSRCAAGPAGLR
jgi:hypothetical protein